MRNREENVEKIEKILLTSIYTKSQNGIITNERISDDLAFFCANRLIDNDIGDVAAFQQENDRLQLAFAKACDMLSSTCFQGDKIIKSDILQFVDDSLSLGSKTAPEACDIVLYEGKVGIFNILMKDAENSEERVGMLFMRGGLLLIPEDEFSKLKVLCRHNLTNLRLMCMTQDELLQLYEKEAAEQ